MVSGGLWSTEILFDTLKNESSASPARPSRTFTMHDLIASIPMIVFICGSLIVIVKWWLPPQLHFVKMARALQETCEHEGRPYSYWSDTSTRLDFSRHEYTRFHKDMDSPQVRDRKLQLIEAHRLIAASLKPCIKGLLIVLGLTIASAILTSQHH
jgi:hypothetical protein